MGGGGGSVGTIAPAPMNNSPGLLPNINNFQGSGLLVGAPQQTGLLGQIGGGLGALSQGLRGAGQAMGQLQQQPQQIRPMIDSGGGGQQPDQFSVFPAAKPMVDPVIAAALARLLTGGRL